MILNVFRCSQLFYDPSLFDDPQLTDDPKLFDDPQLFNDQLEVWSLIIQKSRVIPSSLMVLFWYCQVSLLLPISEAVSQVAGCGAKKWTKMEESCPQRKKA